MNGVALTTECGESYHCIRGQFDSKPALAIHLEEREFRNQLYMDRRQKLRPAHLDWRHFLEVEPIIYQGNPLEQESSFGLE